MRVTLGAVLPKAGGTARLLKRSTYLRAQMMPTYSDRYLRLCGISGLNNFGSQEEKIKEMPP